MIIKRRHTGNFAIIPNAVMSDERISLEARGLLGYLLSKPDDWEVNVSDLRRAGSGLSRNKAYKILKELVGVGYVQREQPRDEAGQMLPMQYEVYDVVQEALPVGYDDDISPVPDIGEADASPRAHSPRPGLPRTVKGDAVLYKDNNKTERTKTDSHKPREREREDLDKGLEEAEPHGDEPEPQTPKQIEKAFKEFGPTWPTWVNDSEPAARKAWQSLDDDDRLKAIARRDDYLTAAKIGGRTHSCSLAKYLSEKRWDKLAAQSLKPDGPVTLGIYGSGWMARRLKLLEGLRRQWTPTRFQQMHIDEKGPLIFSKERHRAEFPEVAKMDGEAVDGRSWKLPIASTPPDTSVFVKIKKDSDLWQQWAAWHEAMDYPWINPPNHIEWFWMPAQVPNVVPKTSIVRADDDAFLEATA